MASFKKFILAYVTIMIVGIVAAQIYAQAQQGRQPYGDITVQEAKTLIEQNLNLKIVDVRLDTEYNTSHLPGAINICVCDPNNLLNLNSNDEILVYCRTGSRSAAAIEFLNEHGFAKVYNMLGGIDAWIAAGYPIVEG